MGAGAEIFAPTQATVAVGGRQCSRWPGILSSGRPEHPPSRTACSGELATSHRLHLSAGKKLLWDDHADSCVAPLSVWRLAASAVSAVAWGEPRSLGQETWRGQAAGGVCAQCGGASGLIELIAVTQECGPRIGFSREARNVSFRVKSRDLSRWLVV